MIKIFGIALFVVALLSGCGEKKEEEKKAPVAKVETKPEVKEEVVKTKADMINEVAADLKSSTNKAIDSAAEIAKEVTEKSAVVAKEMAVETKEMTAAAVEGVKEVQKEIDSKIDSMIQEKEDAAALNIDAKQLYMKCAGCHGQKGERSALNKSQIIKGWESAKTIEALNGYKNDTYGGMMKGVMKSQVANLSDNEIKLLADFISQLK